MPRLRSRKNKEVTKEESWGKPEDAAASSAPNWEEPKDNGDGEASDAGEDRTSEPADGDSDPEGQGDMKADTEPVEPGPTGRRKLFNVGLYVLRRPPLMPPKPELDDELIAELQEGEEIEISGRVLKSPKGWIMGRPASSRKFKEDEGKAETELREALRNQEAEVKLLQKKLAERDQEARQSEDQLLLQLAAEKKDAEELKQTLEQVRSEGLQIASRAEEIQNTSSDWQRKYEELSRQHQEWKAATATHAEMRPMNFWTGLEEELLAGSNVDVVLKVRKEHKELEDNISNATEVHIKSINAQLEGAAAAESKGLPLRRGLTDYEKRTEIESERHTELLRLDARLHGLRALQEEVALEHSLSEFDQQKIKEYLERDMKRCEEELEILNPPSALASVPDQLVEVLQAMAQGDMPERFEHGYSPMHWAAHRGRRDLVEFLRRLVDNGHSLLSSRDDQGRTPLFYAERAGRTGLAYHLRRVGGEADPFRLGALQGFLQLCCCRPQKTRSS